MNRTVYKISGVLAIVTVALVFAIRMSQSAVDALLGVAIGVVTMSPLVGAYFYYRGVEDGIRRCQEMQGPRREVISYPSPPALPPPVYPITNYQAPISYAQAKTTQAHTIE